MLGFRVWDSEDKRFVHQYACSHLNCDGTMSYYHDPMLTRIIYGSDRDRYTPLQSTGLFDILGKEIFEGDIIAFSHDKLDNLNTLIVDDVKAFLINVAFFHRIDPDNFSHTGEVIGNVYENSELLEIINARI